MTFGTARPGSGLIPADRDAAKQVGLAKLAIAEDPEIVKANIKQHADRLGARPDEVKSIWKELGLD